MTFEQTRQAAAALLGGTTGDLVGPDAQRFDALIGHAERLREAQQQRHQQEQRMAAATATVDRIAASRSSGPTGRHN